MADLKISQLNDGGNALGTDQLPINRAGVNFRISAASIAALSFTNVHGMQTAAQVNSHASMLGYDWELVGSAVVGASAGGESGYWAMDSGVDSGMSDRLDFTCLAKIKTFTTRFRLSPTSIATDNNAWVCFTPRSGITVDSPSLLFQLVPLCPVVGFKWRQTVDGPNWQLYSSPDSSGAPVTQVDTGVAVDTAWHEFSMVVSGGGTSVEFFIDGVSVGTISTHLPAPTTALSASLWNESISRAQTTGYWFQNLFWTE